MKSHLVEMPLQIPLYIILHYIILCYKYKPSMPIADVLVRKEKDGSYSTIIVEADHPAHFHYSKTLEKITFKARYGHFNRNGIPQHTLF